MLEIVLAVLASPEGRSAIAAILGDILHRRTVDAAFLAQSDAVFAQRAAATTPEEVASAQDALTALLNS